MLLLLIYNYNIHYMPLYNNPGGGGGHTAYERGGDARRLA